MAREHGRIKTSIWTDATWTDRSEEAQRLYMLLLSQPDVTYAGVMPYRPRRWASLSKGSTLAKVRRAVAELETAGFVCIDEDTEELLIRTFIRHDGVLTQPNVARAMVKAFRNILSATLRDVIVSQLALDCQRDPSATAWQAICAPAADGGIGEELDAVAAAS